MEKDRLVEELDKERNLKAKNPLLYGLYLDSQKDWAGAHEVAQSKVGDPLYDRLHAYLHREEGDQMNARFWYSRLNLEYPTYNLDTEWVILYYEFLES